jgi:hypothetical protein
MHEHHEMSEPLGQHASMLTIRSVRTTPVLVPMTYALGTSAARVTEAPLLLIDLETEEGITGRTYLFCYRPSGARVISLLLDDAVSLIKGEPARPVDIAAKLARSFALIGVTGTVRMALPLASGDTELGSCLSRPRRNSASRTRQPFMSAAFPLIRRMSMRPSTWQTAWLRPTGQTRRAPPFSRGSNSILTSWKPGSTLPAWLRVDFARQYLQKADLALHASGTRHQIHYAPPQECSSRNSVQCFQ